MQVRYITIEAKEVACIGYNRFLFPHSYLGEGLGANYVIKFVSDLRQVGGFLQVLQIPPPIKLTATI